MSLHQRVATLFSALPQRKRDFLALKMRHPRTRQQAFNTRAAGTSVGHRIISTELSEFMAAARLMNTIPKIRVRTPQGDF
jgi:hypothetical protein